MLLTKIYYKIDFRQKISIIVDDIANADLLDINGNIKIVLIN